MSANRNYSAESFPADNWHFSRRWSEPEWVLRFDQTLHEASEKPPDKPSPKRRRAAPASNRPLIKNAQNDNTAEAETCRAAETLFKVGAP